MRVNTLHGVRKDRVRGHPVDVDLSSLVLDNLKKKKKGSRFVGSPHQERGLAPTVSIRCNVIQPPPSLVLAHPPRTERRSGIRIRRGLGYLCQDTYEENRGPIGFSLGGWSTTFAPRSRCQSSELRGRFSARCRVEAYPYTSQGQSEPSKGEVDTSAR